MNRSRNGVLAGGNWIIDCVKLIEAWPPQDALVSIFAESRSNGGSPYNILKDLSRLGAHFPLEGIGIIGDDVGGRMIRDDCDRHRIDTQQLRTTSSAATSYTDVMTVQGTGRRTFFHQRGANALLDVGHFDFTRTRTKFFHLGYLLLMDRLDTLDTDGKPRACAVLASARAAGLKTSVDVVSENSDRFRRVVQPILPYVDVFFANDFEAERLNGFPLRIGGVIQAPAVRDAAHRLLRAGVKGWVVLHFSEGAYACSSAGTVTGSPVCDCRRPRSKGRPGRAMRSRRACSTDCMKAGGSLSACNWAQRQEQLRFAIPRAPKGSFRSRAAWSWAIDSASIPFRRDP